LPHDDTKAVHVCSLVVRLLQRHLGCHVAQAARVARHLIGLTIVATDALSHASAQSEVENLKRTVGDEGNIVGLQI